VVVTWHRGTSVVRGYLINQPARQEFFSENLQSSILIGSGVYRSPKEV
jgi:hypothetical protein